MKLNKDGDAEESTLTYKEGSLNIEAKMEHVEETVTCMTLHSCSSCMLCIDSYGAPTSIVRIPTPLARIGPIVKPQGMSLRTTKSCIKHF